MATQTKTKAMTVTELARFLAAAELVTPAPMTTGDVEAYWASRAVADQQYFERRARQLLRVMNLPRGEAGRHMPRERGKRGGKAA